MASDYGLNFGFRRSDESNATREGRLKTPATGSALLIGTAVQQDAATGYMKQAVANAAPLTGTHGVLVQEESHIAGIYTNPGYGLGHDSIDLGTAKLDQLSVMWGGPSKIWLRNSLVYSRGARSKGAVSIWLSTGVAVGDGLGWNGTKWIKAVTGTTPSWMTVTLVNTSTSGAEYCEAVLNF